MQLNTLALRVFGLMAISILILANSSNPNNGNTGAPGEGTCAGCHSSPPAGVNGIINLTGLPASITPNTTYTLTLTSMVMSGSANTAGFQLVSLNTSNSNAGDLMDISADVGTQTSGNGREYVEHRGDKTIAGGQVSWTFEWTSPTSAPGNGDITMYASSILANNNGNSGGDRTVLNSFVTNLQGGGPAVTISITNSTNASCFGGADGTATALAGGGTQPITYLWSNGQTNPTAINLSAGFYSVTATDAIGQNASANVIIDQPAQLIPQIAAQTDVSCFELSDGQAIGSVNGGTPPYSFSWSSGANGQVANNLSAGTYTLSVTDDNNCQSTTTVTITEPTQLVVVPVSQTNVDCFGNNTGSATVNPSGGTPPYNFSWPNGTMTPSVQNLIAGNHTVTVTDENGCNANFTITITQPILLTISLENANDPACNGAHTGSAEVLGNGGTSPFNYNWSNGASGPIQNNLPAGSYTVTVIDGNNCENSITFSLTDPPGLDITGGVLDVSCGGSCDGAIDLTLSGGNPPYLIDWTTGATTEDISDLCIGNYTVTVTDDDGCSSFSSFQVGGASALTLSILNQTNVDCKGNATGSISVEAFGGSPAYTYLWSSGDPGQTISDLPAGDYSVTVTDADQCTEMLTITIEEPDVLLANTTATGETSNGAEDGTAMASPTGGTMPYEYLWDTGGATAQIIDLAPGTYTVTVTDANNCTSIESITVNPFSCVLEALISSEDVFCAGGSDGSAMVSVSNAIDPVVFNWSSGGDMASEMGLAAGSYSVTVSDATACSIILNFLIGEPNPINISLANVADADCPGAATGQAEVIPEGGTMPYLIMWADGSTEFLRSDLPAGNYQPTITDSNGCMQPLSFPIGEPDELLGNLSSTNETAYQSEDGTAMASPTGGTSPYEFLWETGEMTAEINDLEPGVYQLTITDANDCAAVESVEILAFPCSLSADVSGMNPSCFGLADGTGSATAIGGDGPFTFVWSNGEETQSICDLSGITYSVTIIDANGCPAVADLVLEEPALLEIEVISQISPSCNGFADGQVELNGIGGTGPIVFEWTDEQNNTFTGAAQNMLEAGTYDIISTDFNGCTATLTLDLDEPDALMVSMSSTDETANNANDGSATATPSGGTMPYTYVWSNGAETQAISNLIPGAFMVTVTDANGCLVEDVVSVSPFGCALSISLNPTQISCNAVADGAISLNISDETDPPNIESIEWSTGQEDVSMINNLSPGDYSVTVINESGCLEVASVTISEPDELIALNEGIQHVACFDGISGSVMLSANGGTSPYEYLLNTASVIFGEGETIIYEGLAAGDYTAQLTDSNGCETSISFTVEEPELLELELVESIGVECPGDLTGSATVLATGGIDPYTYIWPFGETGPQQDGLEDGIYPVVVMDANFCETMLDVVIEVLDDTPPDVQVQPILVYLDEDGLASISPADIDNGSTDNCSIESMNLDIDTFDCTDLQNPQVAVTLEVIDNSGNSAQEITEVLVQDTIPPTLILPADTTIFNCDGFFEYIVTATDNCGLADIVLTGGLPSGSNFPIGTTVVSYQVFDEPVHNISFGEFTVTVVNNVSAFIPMPTASCPNEATGSATVIANGGTLPYTYLWDDPASQITETATGLPGDLYNVIVTDASGCEVIASTTVFEFPPVIIEPLVVSNENNGDASGSIELTFSGGDGPFSFEWFLNGDLFAATEDLINLSAGEYQLILTDGNGCSYTLDPVVVENVTGLDKIESIPVRVFPIPADGSILVETPSFGDSQISLFDLSGKSYLLDVEKLSDSKWQLDTATLPNGMYLLKVSNGEQQIIKRIIIQH